MKFIHSSQMVTLLDEFHPFFKWCGTEFDPMGWAQNFLDESTDRVK
jgi:hypothetical protein